MKKQLLTIVILLSVPILLWSQSEREKLFEKANQAYEAGKMQLALERYLDLSHSGEVSFELYYNLGNAYYRLGKIGRAVQYWEKAALLEPANSELIHNLELARLKILDRVVLPQAFFLFEYYWRLRSSTEPSQWLSITAWLAFFTLLVWLLPHWLILPKKLRTMLKSYRRVPAIIFSTTFLLLSFVSLDALRYSKENRNAVVISREVQVKSAPLPQSNTLFILHEGSKVKLISENHGEWYEISYFDDKSGWVRQDDLGEI